MSESLNQDHLLPGTLYMMILRTLQGRVSAWLCHIEANPRLVEGETWKLKTARFIPRAQQDAAQRLADR